MALALVLMVALGVSKVLKFYVKVFYVMGKACLYANRLFCHFSKWGWGASSLKGAANYFL